MRLIRSHTGGLTHDTDENDISPMTRDPALTFAIALAAGMIAQTIAHYLRATSIVVLLLMGVLLGPDVLNFVKPDSLGHGLSILVELAVAVILFEGALNLNLDRIRQEAKTIRGLITVGALIAAITSIPPSTAAKRA
jgi:NhaP-type Na+/H+ or K+/H+ antiporter